MCLLRAGPLDVGAKTVRQLRDLYWAKKNDVFDTTPLLLKKAEENAKVLETTLKEWLGEDVVMRRTTSCTGSNPTPIPRCHNYYNHSVHGFTVLCKTVVHWKE